MGCFPGLAGESVELYTITNVYQQPATQWSIIQQIMIPITNTNNSKLN